VSCEVSLIVDAERRNRAGRWRVMGIFSQYSQSPENAGVYAVFRCLVLIGGSKMGALLQRKLPCDVPRAGNKAELVNEW
jgi:hypothetical protein